MDSVTVNVRYSNVKSEWRDVPGVPGLKWALHVTLVCLNGLYDEVATYIQVVGGRVTVSATIECSIAHSLMVFTKTILHEFKYGERHGFGDPVVGLIGTNYSITCKATFEVKNNVPVQNTDLRAVKLHELIDKSKPHWADTKIVVGKTDIKVHRGFLSMISPVFNAMFSPETKEFKTGVVNIADFTVETVQNALDYCYGTDLGKKTVAEIIDMLRFYDKYDIELLVTKLEASLKANLTTNNFAPIAWQYSRESLQAECGRLIHENKEIAFLPEFLALDPTVIASVLKAGLISTAAVLPKATI
uniref:BTB domain-containing protein n=1 Tax=Panagrellus redivivus TaxID=6233 RepID=A0A7E4UR81_PANRE